MHSHSRPAWLVDDHLAVQICINKPPATSGLAAPSPGEWPGRVKGSLSVRNLSGQTPAGCTSSSSTAGQAAGIPFSRSIHYPDAILTLEPRPARPANRTISRLTGTAQPSPERVRADIGHEGEGLAGRKKRTRLDGRKERNSTIILSPHRMRRIGPPNSPATETRKSVNY